MRMALLLVARDGDRGIGGRDGVEPPTIAGVGRAVVTGPARKFGPALEWVSSVRAVFLGGVVGAACIDLM
jgi:hypothetical protein